jgi:dipeptidyl aminopeptidase/acylaminoacyl peptidase
MVRSRRFSRLVFFVLSFVSWPSSIHAQALETVAEKSGYRATSRHAEVMDFCRELVLRSPLVKLSEMGVSTEGRKLPLLILADPPLSTPEEAARSHKLVVYAQGDIHAGEVDGKEGILMLARDIATGPQRALLKNLVVVFCPIFNPDGNDRMAKTNRPGQVGPEEGMGTRHNAQDLDLNRDFVKLESPEVRALVAFLHRWNPAMVIDTHTTNGSFHRYLITYDGPRNAATDPALVARTRDILLPDAGKRLEQVSGYKSFYYGDFSPDHQRWETYPATPRYGVPYFGLRNEIGILSESYAYASYKDRVLASRDFVRACLEYAAAHAEELRGLLAEARERSIKAGKDPRPDDRVAIRQKPAALGKPFTILGFIEEKRDGRTVATSTPRDYTAQYMGLCEPARTVARPYAYIIPADRKGVIENLQRHGIQVDMLREDIELPVEVATITKIERGKTPFQKHYLVSLEAKTEPQTRMIRAGSFIVPTGQPLGNLIVYLLEAESEDGLATWNFFDDAIHEGQPFPVWRLPRPAPLTTIRTRSESELHKERKPVTFVAAYGSEPPLNLGGNPVTGLSWLEDGEHYLQNKSGTLYKIHARTGRCERLYDPDQLARGLSTLTTISKKAAAELSHADNLHMNPQKTGALFLYHRDLYFANLDGSRALRLTKNSAGAELQTFSPDGQRVAFVRKQNLCVVDLATQTERALTTDGGGPITNGKADWVYFEELFNRNWQAYWWSPDSRNLLFLRLDDRPVPSFTVIDQVPIDQVAENTAYPKPGGPNPLVKLGIASVDGGPVHWVESSAYPEASSLIVHAGWKPDSQEAYFYVQDRTQTWLDVCMVPVSAGPARRLLHETTKAWVDDPGPASFLEDGSFLLTSERTGWKHIYRFDKEGRLLGPVTSGDWEVSAVARLDEKAGWVYFSATKDSPIASNLYRAKLDGSKIERVTQVAGDHRVEVSPRSELVLDWNSSHERPIQVCLLDAKGSIMRTIDTNPVYVLDEFTLGKFELVQIQTPDGFTLEGSLVKPPDFDPSRSYPAWFVTYGGPHTPTVRDSWASASQVFDQLLAHLGFVVFHCDPRSASGKGAVSTWNAYKRLGVNELKDIETAISWLTSHSFIDRKRVGMSGHSFGGFMTAFAMTHCKLFSAGIAGAPVTDWRDYDTIYTERFMGTPQENAAGYDATSVVSAAANLHGKLLIIHGLMDDNVHFQNTVRLVQELQKADKDFEMMVYPRSRHPIMSKHYRRLMIDFIVKTLGTSAAPLGAP